MAMKGPKDRAQTEPTMLPRAIRRSGLKLLQLMEPSAQSKHAEEETCLLMSSCCLCKTNSTSCKIWTVGTKVDLHVSLNTQTTNSHTKQLCSSVQSAAAAALTHSLHSPSWHFKDRKIYIKFNKISFLFMTQTNDQLKKVHFLSIN